MIWVDYVIVGIILVSALISLARGFVREALSLAAWIVAFWVALTFSNALAMFLGPYISVPSVRLIASFAALFLTTLLLGALVNYLAAQLVEKTGLTGTDRAVGILFGGGRGVMIVALLVLIAGLTPLPTDPWWKESLLIRYFQDIALWIRGFLPPEVASNIIYE